MPGPRCYLVIVTTTVWSVRTGVPAFGSILVTCQFCGTRTSCFPDVASAARSILVKPRLRRASWAMAPFWPTTSGKVTVLEVPGASDEAAPKAAGAGAWTVTVVGAGAGVPPQPASRRTAAVRSCNEINYFIDGLMV